MTLSGFHPLVDSWFAETFDGPTAPQTGGWPAIMAGRAAEEIVFGDVSTFGAGTPDSDLAAATAIARGIEMTTGFGEAGVIYLEEASASQKLDPAVNKSIRRRVEAALARASALLLDNRRELEGGDALRQAPTEPNLPLLN